MWWFIDSSTSCINWCSLCCNVSNNYYHYQLKKKYINLLILLFLLIDSVQEADLEVRAGEWDTQTKNEILPHQDRAVQRIIVHENYIAGSLKNDFALLYLREPVVLSDNVDIVCLPQVNDIFDNSRCFASGWGKDVFGIYIFYLYT